MGEQIEIGIHSWIEKLQSQGTYTFSLANIQEQLPGYSGTAIKSALNRLTKKGTIISIHKGYYLIIPPQYKSKGVLPPTLYLDAFMMHLNRPYYLGLINAAAYHGASHQQPQEFFVVTTFPVLRPTIKKGLKVNYISKKEIPDTLIESRKTEAGYLNISNPVLTATDLIQYEKRIGGINRAATILNELAEAIKPEVFNKYLLQKSPVTTLQRLGYLLEHECKNHVLADALFKLMKGNDAKLFRIPLKTLGTKKGFSSENRWKVIVNTEIEIDE